MKLKCTSVSLIRFLLLPWWYSSIPFILFIIHSCAVVLSGIFLHLLSLRALNHNVRRLAGRQFFQLPVRGTAGLSMRASQSRRGTESGNDGWWQDQCSGTLLNSLWVILKNIYEPRCRACAGSAAGWLKTFYLAGFESLTYKCNFILKKLLVILSYISRSTYYNTVIFPIIALFTCVICRTKETLK